MVRSCILCKRCAKKNTDRSFHRFPKDPEMKTKWLKALGLSESSIKSQYASVCSGHFSPEDLVSKGSGRFLYIRSNAIPLAPSHKSMPTCIRNVEDNKCSIDVSEIQLIGSEKDNFRTQESTTDRNVEDTKCSIDIQLNSSEKETLKTQESTTDRSEISLRRVSESTVSVHDPLASDNCTNSDSSDCSSSTISAPETQCILKETNSRKRLPRYFGDCSSDDMDNPAKARRNWQIAKKTILQQKIKIKDFYRETSRLKSKVQALNSVIKFLTEKQALTSAELHIVSGVSCGKEKLLNENMSDKDDVIDLVSETQDQPPSPTQPQSASAKVILRENVPNVKERISEMLPNHAARTTKRSERMKKSVCKSKLEDEFTFFGNNVASQLRQLPLEQALICQSEIMSILTERRLAGIKSQSRSSQYSVQISTSQQPYYIIPKSCDMSTHNSSKESSRPPSIQDTSLQNNSSNSNVIIYTLQNNKFLK